MSKGEDKKILLQLNLMIGLFHINCWLKSITDTEYCAAGPGLQSGDSAQLRIFHIILYLKSWMLVGENKSNLTSP